VYETERLESSVRWLRSLTAFAALAMAVFVWTEDADARLKSELAFGGSAAGNFTLPPIVGPAPILVASLDHIVGGQQSGSLDGLFNRPGLLGGFAAGFLGAGLLGLLFGHGVFGELGGVASFLGLAFQLALVIMLCRLIWTWWTGRNLPAFSGLSPRQLADPYLRPSLHEFPAGGGVMPADERSRLAEQASARGERDA
jgi:hypothetical protein